jgi:type II secretory ATPase GspE/PulE/Tfp pilus assembly ATPase PilB-like protein
MPDNSKTIPFKPLVATVAISPEKVIDPSSLSERSSTEARNVLPYTEALRLKALPLLIERHDGRQILHLAASRGKEEVTRQAVRFHSGMDVSIVPVPLRTIEEEIFKAYKGDAKELVVLPEQQEPSESSVFHGETLLTAYDSGEGDAAKGLAALIDYGIARGISDIHLTPLQGGVRIRARKNGCLLEREQLVGDHTFHREVVNRLKILVRAPQTTVMQPLDGSFSAGTDSNPARVRVSIMPSVHGESVVLRILTNTGLETLETLQYSNKLLRRFNECIKKPSGLLLVCGATGSGKTTTLYALAQKVSMQNRVVHTLEEPVEKTVDSFVQTEINKERGVGYEQCLPAVLRQDPDCILLGELRDSVSANAIVQASLTGHLTLSSVHSSDVPSVLKRFEQFGVAKDEFSSAIIGIVCQRLVKQLCKACKVMDLQVSRECGHRVSKAVGCPSCDYTGYVGRVPLVEAFFPSEQWQSCRGEGDVKEAVAGTYFAEKNGLEHLLKEGTIDWPTYSDVLDE